MRNIILILIEVITCYVALVMLYKKYKTDGVYIYIILLGIISSIMNFKMISIMNVPIPLGFGVTMSILIGVNLMIQKRGTEELKPCIIAAIIPLIISYIILYLSTLMTNSNYNILSNVSYNNIFSQNIRIYIALIASLLFTIWLDGKLYYIIKKLQNRFWKQFPRIRFSFWIQSFDNEVLQLAWRKTLFLWLVDFLRWLQPLKQDNTVFNFDFIAFWKWNKSKKWNRYLWTPAALEFFTDFVNSLFADSFSLYTLELIWNQKWQKNRWYR